MGTPDCTHAMSNEHIAEALEWIDKRSGHLETLTRKALDKEKAVDSHLTCPLTYELFVDPVFCAGDGQTYERSAIERWIKMKKTSPFNNLPLKSTKIYPNYHARKLADMYRQGSAPEGRSNELPVSQDRNDQQNDGGCWTKALEISRILSLVDEEFGGASPRATASSNYRERSV